MAAALAVGGQSDDVWCSRFALELVVITGVLLLLMGGGAMLTDGAWMDLEPLLEACRPKGRTPPRDLRRTTLGDRLAA